MHTTKPHPAPDAPGAQLKIPLPADVKLMACMRRRLAAFEGRPTHAATKRDFDVLAELFGKTARVEELTPAAMKEATRTLVEDRSWRWSGASVERLFNQLRSVLRAAVFERRLLYIPEAVQPQPLAALLDQAPDTASFRRLLRACKTPREKRHLLGLFCTGAPLGTLRALDSAEIDFRGGVIALPATRTPRAYVPLAASFAAALDRAAHGPVYGSGRDSSASPKAFRAVAERAGLPDMQAGDVRLIAGRVLRERGIDDAIVRHLIRRTETDATLAPLVPAEALSMLGSVFATLDDAVIDIEPSGAHQAAA